MGTAGRDCVFVDVEAAPGVIAVGGDPAQRLSVIAAMAAGLVTSAWSGRIRITLVGFGVGLTVFAPGRVRHSESLEELLPELDVESAERARLLAASGAGSVLTGRLSAEQATSWTPHVVLVGEQPSARMRARLAALGVAGSRVGISYLVAGEVPGAAWRFEAGPDGVLRAPLLDIEVAAHRLPVAGEVATGGRPVDHELWCHLLRAAHVARDVARLQSAVGELYRRTIVHRGVHGLHPATRALVDELPMR
jgi:hypothetical protein